jgi:polyisoprenoid-binding protein YceI
MTNFIAIVAMVLVPTISFATSWRIDPNRSSVRFTVPHLAVSSVEGVFHRFSGMASIHDKDITRSEISVTIDAASVTTGTAKLDDELRSEGFLDTARYPTVSFSAKRIARSGADGLKVTGDLTIHGQSREVVLDVKGPSAATRGRDGKVWRSASAVARVSRRAFGLNWDTLLAAGLGDDIDISLDIVLVRK